MFQLLNPYSATTPNHATMLTHQLVRRITVHIHGGMAARRDLLYWVTELNRDQKQRVTYTITPKGFIELQCTRSQLFWLLNQCSEELQTNDKLTDAWRDPPTIMWQLHNQAQADEYRARVLSN